MNPQRFVAMGLFGAVALLGNGCGGYKAADEDDLKAREGEIVGVLVDSKGKAHVDGKVHLIDAEGTEIISSNDMDSDGSFSLWPPEAGTYNVIGVLGDLDKAIKQGIVYGEDHKGINIGKISLSKVGILAVQVEVPEGMDPYGVGVHVLGTDSNSSTIEEGVGALADIPAGTYTVRFSKDGLADLEVEDVVIKSEATTTLDDVVLTQ